MYLLILCLPLWGSLISGFTGRWIGTYGSSLITTLFIFCNFIISIFIFIEITILNSLIHITFVPWIYSDLLQVDWAFLFDALTATMLVVINSISFLVHLYSIGYLDEDPHRPRFMAYLSIFTFFMLVLVTADNLIQMFVGWEGVGIASYLLINFWFTRLSANQAALKALITNRIGDFGLSLAILISFFVFGSTNYLTIFSTAPLFESYMFTIFHLNVSYFSLFGFFLLLGAVGKSAQLGLHVWLPDAMEGPTPVSALIHAATMVTAGVFLVIRFSPVLEFSTFTLFLLTLFGSLTAFFASLTGTFQNDLKKIIAYSTCSQLGYMMFACGLSHYNVSLFHLANHAFFKALLFLAAGSVIHAIADEQDLRRMGALVSSLPLTYVAIFIGSLALTGFPFLTGFYSKDLILEITQVYRLKNLIFIGSLACVLGNLAVFLTAFYSFRLLFFCFLNSPNLNRNSFLSISESSFFITLPLILLTICSIFVGYLGRDLFVGFGSPVWNNVIFSFGFNVVAFESEFILPILKWFPFIFSVLAFLTTFILNTTSCYTFSPQLAFFINKKWYWDVFYSRFVVLPILSFGLKTTFKVFDRGFIELLGPYGFTKTFSQFASLLQSLQTGQLTHYTFFITFFFFLILTQTLITTSPFFHLILLFFI